MKGLSASFVASSRRKRAEDLVAAWVKSDQAMRIKATLGPIIMAACKWEAARIAEARTPEERGAILLTMAQVKTCDERVVSQARAAAYGPWALNTHDKGARWKREYEQTRAMILKGMRPPRLGELVLAENGE